MKISRLITALVLVLVLVLGMPLVAQAQEQWRDVTLKNAYRVSDTQIVLEFSEPVAFDETDPWIDIRLTNQSDGILGVYDKAGNRTGWYNWQGSVSYLNADHDKIVFTMNAKYGCHTISDLLGSHGDLPADIKEKLDDGTYKFIITIEEVALSGGTADQDGMIRNVYAQADHNVFLWPTRPSATEAANWDLDKLNSKPSWMVVDETQFEAVGDNGQNWNFGIMAPGTALLDADKDLQSETETKVTTVTVVNNNPMAIALILGVSVLLAVVLVVVWTLVSKKRKAA